MGPFVPNSDSNIDASHIFGIYFMLNWISKAWPTSENFCPLHISAKKFFFCFKSCPWNMTEIKKAAQYVLLLANIYLFVF